ncbi:MAG: hypothetical protein NC133_03615 [Prevotella sp.]|nr:hypothetical protein [Prevotella sp.]
MILGAFFVGCFSVWAPVLPAGAVALLAAATGQTEMAVGIIWGTVAINLGCLGLLSLGWNVRADRAHGCRHGLWLTMGWGVCLLAGRSGTLGVFTGVGLLVVGLVALWLWLRQPNDQPTVCPDQNKAAPRAWWQWVVLVGAVLGIIVGSWGVVWQQATVEAVLELPTTLCAVVVTAPLLGISSWLGIRRNRQWQPERLLRGWLTANVLLATVGLGLAAIFSGGLRLTASTVGITLPWVAGMVVVSMVMLFLPRKTARWWGGLLVGMYLACLVSLFW